MQIRELEKKADQIRKMVVEMIGRLGVGHVGGALSAVDLVTALYYKEMKIDPKNPKWKERDRFVMSKGHAGPALYAVLADKGYFDKEHLKTLNLPNTILPSHCDMNKTPGVDMTAGSLGQGLSCAVGMALAARLDNLDYYVYALIGDGESQEGQIYEALMFAAHKRLNNLIVFIDNNRMQIDGYTDDINKIEPIDKKADAFGYFTQRVNGHDIQQILDAIKKAKAQTEKPSFIVLDTIKGYKFKLAEEKGPACHNMSIDETDWREYACCKEE
ncbi:MAG: transketolase [Bacillota bacterium]|nr:transketolase [Bacillota bacterium]HHU43755.1 transketolase [Clostridiales bacterium]